MSGPTISPFFKKHRPSSTSELQGQDKAVVELKNYIASFKSSKIKKAAIIYGPPGTGKTCSVHALANDLNLEILEINASDFRNADNIDSILGSASRQMSLFAKGKLILFDEIDGLSGNKDRGGLQALMKIIPKSAFPIVCTMQNPYDQKFATIRKKSLLIEFHSLNYLSINKVLENICSKESIKFEPDILKSLARRSGGDLRSAINDLQLLTLGSNSLEKDDLDLLADRDKVESMLSALIKVFKNSDPKIALDAFNNVDEDIDKQILWLDQNIPVEYTRPADLARAYDSLSRADVFLGRIRRWQHWRFLVYASSHITAGVSSAKDEKYKTFNQYKPTQRILSIWKANMKYMKRRSIAEKVAEKTHSSTKAALQSTLPYLQHIYKHNKDKTSISQMTGFFDFGDDEVTWLQK